MLVPFIKLEEFFIVGLYYVASKSKSVSRLGVNQFAGAQQRGP